MIPSRRLLPALSLVLLAAACSGAQSNTTEAALRNLCPAAGRQSAPLVVEWSSAARGQLEALRAHHVVAVRSSGCDIEVLPRCEVPARYAYQPITTKHERIAVHDDDELYANLPLHATALSGKLKNAGELDVDLTIVGRYEADRAEVRPDELRGDCAGVTHVVHGLSAGAFTFSSGSDKSVTGSADAGGLGAGATSVHKREILNQDGNAKACASASAGDKAPPYGCGALVRIELVPIGGVKQDAPSCSATTQWDGHQCVRVDPGGCPAQTVFAQGACMPEDGKTCPATYRLEEGHGCVREGGAFVSDPCPRGHHHEGGGCAPDAAGPGPMVKVPGGNFMIGSHCDDYLACSPAHSVNVAPFEIDLTEVTVAAYKACVDAGRCLVPPSDGACNWGKDNREHHPINCIDWDAARTYCTWVGKRLPTEAEWEFAAVGQTGWIHPWGNDPADKTRACSHNVDTGDTCEVGSAPAGRSRFGLLDMTDNVKEWTADAWCLYRENPQCDAKMRTVRNARPAAHREGVRMDVKAPRYGFRCAKGG